MSKMKNQYYNPKIIDNLKVSGIASSTIPAGKKGNIIVRKFISSDERYFATYFNNIISLFDIANAGNLLNKLLVIIKPDFKAYIYDSFPLSMNIKATKNLKNGVPVMLGDFADLINVSFKDSTIDLNPEKGDQIIWLFRQNWRFGLYFDFSRQQRKEVILEEIASHYKRLLYFDTFTFLSAKENFNELVADGWFPFIRLLNGQFESLISFYEEEKKYKVHIKKIINNFDDRFLYKMMENWWQNPILNSKKVIIHSGVESYMTKTKMGFINCIKTLITEIEGIIRIAVYQETGNKKTNTKDLKEFIVNSGKRNFSSQESLAFPNEFMSYLTESIFKQFDLESNIPSSRHSIAHGVAIDENYTQERALQLILTIDQIVYFLGKKEGKEISK